MSRSLDIRLTASWTDAFARRRKRCRFSRLLLPGFKRLSMMCIAIVASASAGLLYPHVPLDEPANLTLGVAALHHPFDELSVLLFGIAVLLRSKGDDGKQIFHLREYSLLDHLTDLFIAGPCRVLSAVLSARAKRKFNHLIAKVLGIGDTRRLFDLGELLIEKLAIHQLTGVGILEVLIFDPGVRVVDVAIEQVLTVIRIGFEIGFL